MNTTAENLLNVIARPSGGRGGRETGEKNEREEEEGEANREEVERQSEESDAAEEEVDINWDLGEEEEVGEEQDGGREERVCNRLSRRQQESIEYGYQPYTKVRYLTRRITGSLG